jgi:hypothetical protein
VAAATQLDLQAASTSSVFKIRDLEWQKESWRHYDICGEFRFVANRQAAAMSRCRLLVAEVDNNGRPGREVEDPAIQLLSEGMFGGPAAKSEVIRTIGIQEYVAGECYVIAIGGSGKQDDKWFVASPAELKKQVGSISVKLPMTFQGGGGYHVLRPKQDLIMRVWTPHPRLFDVADSPARAVLPTLREIERLTQLLFSQIDSRLISAGLLLLAEGIDFPAKGDKPGGIQGLQEAIMEAAQAQLLGAGGAAGLVPIMATVPGQVNGSHANIGQSFAHIKFDSPIQAELQAKLDQAIRRLALGLDVAPEDLLGQGDANHWGSWQIEETSIKLFIEPVLTRLCDAFTTAYLAPALKAMGKDPDDYTLWYDTSPLTVRPNRMEDAMQLWDRGVIGDEALVTAGAFDGGDQPQSQDRLKWMAWQLVKANPPMIAAPGLAELLGFPKDVIQAGLSAPGPQQIAPEQPPQGQQPDSGSLFDSAGAAGDIPDQPAGQTSPAQRGRRKAPDTALTAATEQVVFRALELAGSRLLDRTHRGRYGDVARFELHTRITPRDQAHAVELMTGAWDHLPRLAEHFGINPVELRDLLSGYCAELLVRGMPHQSDLLSLVLEKGLGR